MSKTGTVNRVNLVGEIHNEVIGILVTYTSSLHVSESKILPYISIYKYVYDRELKKKL